MQQFDYVILAYGIAFFILVGGAWLIFKRDRTLRRLVANLTKS